MRLAFIEEAAVDQKFNDTLGCHEELGENRDWDSKMSRCVGLVGVGHGGFDDLIRGGHAGEHLADAVLAQGAHAQLAGAAPEQRGREVAR